VPFNTSYPQTEKLTFENFDQANDAELTGLSRIIVNDTCYFSKVSSLLNVLCKMTIELTFENFHQANDAELSGVSHIIVDEIHERGINEDFLLIILKDLITRNAKIKVYIYIYYIYV